MTDLRFISIRFWNPQNYSFNIRVNSVTMVDVDSSSTGTWLKFVHQSTFGSLRFHLETLFNIIARITSGYHRYCVKTEKSLHSEMKHDIIFEFQLSNENEL